MDNEGAPFGQDQLPQDGQQDLNLGGGLPGAGGEENVDQYFDDGGETFLPADHVSRLGPVANTFEEATRRLFKPFV